jgi:hypothetical protein
MVVFSVVTTASGVVVTTGRASAAMASTAGRWPLLWRQVKLRPSIMTTIVTLRLLVLRASVGDCTPCSFNAVPEKSGAVEIYDRIFGVRAVDCSVCEKEFQSGRKCHEPHSDDKEWMSGTPGMMERVRLARRPNANEAEWHSRSAF